jgi:DNA-binding transcriptional ArsR family regulator
MAKKSTLVIRDAAVLRALRTPLRQEILCAMDAADAVSVRDIAAALGRKPASLYYHVHDLARVGLVREAGTRPAGRRTEVLYEPAAQRIVIDRTVRTPAFLAALEDLERATLRTSERELFAARAGDPTGACSPGEPGTLLRLTARLSKSDAVAARARLGEFLSFLEERNDANAGEAYSFTGVLVGLRRPKRG